MHTYNRRPKASDRYRDATNKRGGFERWTDGGADKHLVKDKTPIRIPIDLKPSGILTKYLHITNPELSLSKSKYFPPGDAIIPTPVNCRFHIFKYNEETDVQTEIPIYNYKSFFIIGRDENIADIVVPESEDGDLVSKEHAVLQFRKNEVGDIGTDEIKSGDGNSNSEVAKLYLMDTGSTNGTFLNDEKNELPTKRYIELKNNDVFKVGDYESILEFMIIEDE